MEEEEDMDGERKREREWQVQQHQRVKTLVIKYRLHSVVACPSALGSAAQTIIYIVLCVYVCMCVCTCVGLTLRGHTPLGNGSIRKTKSCTPGSNTITLSISIFVSPHLFLFFSPPSPPSFFLSFCRNLSPSPPLSLSLTGRRV